MPTPAVMIPYLRVTVQGDGTQGIGLEMVNAAFYGTRVSESLCADHHTVPFTEIESEVQIELWDLNGKGWKRWTGVPAGAHFSGTVDQRKRSDRNGEELYLSDRRWKAPGQLREYKINDLCKNNDAFDRVSEHGVLFILHNYSLSQRQYEFREPFYQYDYLRPTIVVSCLCTELASFLHQLLFYFIVGQLSDINRRRQWCHSILYEEPSRSVVYSRLITIHSKDASYYIWDFRADYFPAGQPTINRINKTEKISTDHKAFEFSRAEGGLC